MSLYLRKKRTSAADPAPGSQPTKKFTTGRLYWQPPGQDGYIDLGNLADYKAAPKRDRVEHLASDAGRKFADLSLAKSISELKTFTLDEEFAHLLLLLALGTRHANLVQAAQNDVTADESGVTVDDGHDTVDGNGEVNLPVVVAGRVYNLGAQAVTIVSIKDNNGVNLVLGTHYLIDAGSGMLTVLVANPAPWTVAFTNLAVTDLVFSAYDALFTAGQFRLVESDQFSAIPLAVETFSGQCYVTAWGENNNDKFTEFTLEVLITP